MHPVGFEPTHLSIAELKSAPLDHSGTNACSIREKKETQGKMKDEKEC